MSGVEFVGRIFGAMAACLLASACVGTNTVIKADEFGDADTATYLILSDQLQRVRNVREAAVRSGSLASEAARICVGLVLHGPRRGVLAPVDGAVVDRLRTDQAESAAPFDVVSNYECLVRYVTDSGGFTPEHSDALSYAGEGDGYLSCGRWFGGTSDRETIQYNIEVKDGVARLASSSRCTSIRWIRS